MYFIVHAAFVRIKLMMMMMMMMIGVTARNAQRRHWPIIVAEIAQSLC